MKCKQVKELMGAYLYGDLEPEDMHLVRLHIQECDECRADLESRGKVVSSLSGEMPALTDSERDNIARSVRSQIRNDARAPIWWLKPASAVALAALLLAGFAIGRQIGSGGNSQKNAVKSFVKKPSKAIVTITEAPPQSLSEEDQQPTYNKRRYKRQRSKSISNIADYTRRMTIPAVTTTDRNNNQDKRKEMIVDDPVQVVTPTEQNMEPEVDTTNKLPKPTGLNDVQTNE